MSNESLSAFIQQLEDAGDVMRIAAPVACDLELAEITQRVCKQHDPDGGPVLFFECVKGHSIPVVVNLLGSKRRLCQALQTESFDHVAARLAGLLQPDVPEGWLESLKLIPRGSQPGQLPPRIVKSGMCQQVVKMGRDVNLAQLPIPRCWPDERAPTITLGQVYTKNADTGVRNMGLYPLEVRDGNSLFVHWNEHHAGFWNYCADRDAKRAMNVAVALGGDPMNIFLASAPLPPQADACLFGGFLRNAGMPLVKCRSIDMEVPADAEIVIEGTIDPQLEPQIAGPVAERTGFYALERAAPVLNVSALTHRANPLFPALVTGMRPREDYWLGEAGVRIFLPVLRLFVPDVVDLHLPRAGVFRNLAFVSIAKQIPHQAHKVMNALWSQERSQFLKMIVVVDADVDVHDEEAVWFHVGANVHPARDVIFCPGPTHMSDHAAPVRGVGHKMGIDATRKLPEEGHARPWPAILASAAETQALVSQRWSEYGIDPQLQRPGK